MVLRGSVHFSLVHKTHICTHYTMSCFIFYKEGKEFSEVFFAFLLIMNFVRFKTDTFTFSIAFIDHISVAIQSLLSMDFNFEYLNALVNLYSATIRRAET